MVSQTPEGRRRGPGEVERDKRDCNCAGRVKAKKESDVVLIE